MSDTELTVKLLDLKFKIDSASSSLIRATLRQRAAALAAAFVDQTWAIQEQFVTHPPLRSGVEMSQDTDPSCGF